MDLHRVYFLPDGVEVQVEAGTTIWKAAQKAGLAIKSTCGGQGTCGRCAVIVQSGKVERGATANLSPQKLNEGWVLACQAKVQDNIVVEIPLESRLAEHQVLTSDEKRAGTLTEQEIDEKRWSGPGLIWRQTVKLSPPSLTDNTDDWSRLLTVLRKQTENSNIQIRLSALAQLAEALREGNWEVTVTLALGAGVTEVVDISPGQNNSPLYGIAVDIGTTTVVVQLINLITGERLDVRGTYNRQAKFGDDVISRIVHAVEVNGGLEELKEAVRSTINELVQGLCRKNGISPTEIKAVVCAGNTTMTHLLLGIDPNYIRLEPYIPTINFVPPIRAKELDLLVDPEAWVHALPSIASYVGGDITSGVLYTGMAEQQELTLLIDIGTNGEMVLGNEDWLIACSCSAGPAFEGGGIKFGMRAMYGAIERVEIGSDGKVKLKTIGNGKPVGICGSGLIDCIARLRDAGIIDRTGKFANLKHPRVRQGEEGPEFVLAWAEDSGIEQDITISEADIKNLIRSKGAIFAGIRVMLGMVDLPLEAVDRILIAGGFGNYLNIKDAVTIGLLPDLPEEKYRFIGNSSLKGACLALTSQAARAKVDEIAAKMTYLELSVGNTFMDEFVSALFLPHTDLSLFPSIEQKHK
ncbi:MAG: ASKHA domain-containing protein [Bacillota bacterium]